MHAGPAIDFSPGRLDKRARLIAYHDKLLRDFAGAFDVDTTGEQKQLSLGMRIVSLSLIIEPRLFSLR